MPVTIVHSVPHLAQPVHGVKIGAHQRMRINRLASRAPQQVEKRCVVLRNLKAERQLL